MEYLASIFWKMRDLYCASKDDSTMEKTEQYILEF